MVGGGTVGAWCAYFLRQAGLGTVVLVEKGVLGQGSSSRAAGVVRVQGGTPEAVRLGQWSRAFYLRQRDEIGTDSGFTQQGYLLPAFTRARGGRGARQDRDAAVARAAGPLAGGRRGRRGQPDPRAGARRSARPTATEDGYITPPRNVAAYTAALVASGVTVAERTRFTGLSADGRTVRTSRGDIAAGAVILAGGPQLAAVGALAGLTIPAGGVRHHVAVTEEHPAFADTPDGVRRAVRPVLAAGGGRAALRHERPG